MNTVVDKGFIEDTVLKFRKCSLELALCYALTVMWNDWLEKFSLAGDEGEWRHAQEVQGCSFPPPPGAPSAAAARASSVTL